MTDNPSRKFGKHIQKRQLEIPEYAAYFVDYKALKKLIKRLSSTPPLRTQNEVLDAAAGVSPQTNLQANKASFFFRLDRELEKVNRFYTLKEAELKVRLRILLDKKKSMQLRVSGLSKTSTEYVTLEQGFRQFSKDLDKLQQFVEINATAFSKILKKWDKTSKSQTKEQYLSRAVEIQPCFNRDVISDLSDQATTSLLECSAWAEGEELSYDVSSSEQIISYQHASQQTDIDSEILEVLTGGDVHTLRDFLSHLGSSPGARQLLSKAFLSAVNTASEEALTEVLATGLVDLRYQDEINARNCLHKAAISGRIFILQLCLGQVDVTSVDAYGRIPLHYACTHGHVGFVRSLVEAAPSSIDVRDLDNFTALIHAITHTQLECVRELLALGAKIDPSSSNDHIPLNTACQHDSLPIVELLLQRKPQILPDAEGLYPQHLVARSGKNPQMLLLLKEHDVNLDQPDNLYQWTPLFHAASEGHLQCLEVLLKLGAAPDNLDEKGMSALYYATWEGHLGCMKILAQLEPSRARTSTRFQTDSAPIPLTSDSLQPSENEGIPDFSLPPPILPTRRYGHNFLDAKTLVVISFEDNGSEAVRFYDEGKYPAARLTIAPRTPDALPRNLLLPLQDEDKSLSFQVDNLQGFAVDFDIFPAFGKKVIAKGSVPAEVFQEKTASWAVHYCPLLDPRLKCIGLMSFKFQVIKPFPGMPLEITPYATYWKATSHLQSQRRPLVTGSSLSGDYVRLYVQLSSDGVAVLHPCWTANFDRAIRAQLLEVPIGSLTYSQFHALSMINDQEIPPELSLSSFQQDMSGLHRQLATSHMSLAFALSSLPINVNVELHLLYPTPEEERRCRLGPTPNINDFVDVILATVFHHARHLRQDYGDAVRSIVFSSYNKDICTALNWKQPNYPVLLCNDLGIGEGIASNNDGVVQSSGRQEISVKEAVRIAQANNFMGLTCVSRLLDMAPALTSSIKAAGLVLVSDISRAGSPSGPSYDRTSSNIPKDVDGVFGANGVLRFKESVDM